MIRVTDQQFWMDPYLKRDLDSVVHNLKNDWDFVIPITGDGRTRVGKSHLGFQIAYYMSWRQGLKFDHTHVVFGGRELRNLAPTLPKGSVIVLDEGRAELDSKKTMHGVSMDLQDYFAECGMYNHVIIVILPDFFELNKNIALNRSEFLINVYVKFDITRDKDGNEVDKLVRGEYEVYNRKAKRKLYYWGKRNAGEYNSNFKTYFGMFRNHWTIDREAYEDMKLRFLQRTKEERGKGKYWKYYCGLLYAANKRFTFKELAQGMKEFGIMRDSTTLSSDLQQFTKEMEDVGGVTSFSTHKGGAAQDMIRDMRRKRDGTKD